MITEPRLHETLATPTGTDGQGWAGAVGISIHRRQELSVYSGCLLTFVRIRDDGYTSAWIISIVIGPIIIIVVDVVVIVVINNCSDTRCKTATAADWSLSIDLFPLTFAASVERISYYVYRWYNIVCSLLRSLGPSSFPRDLSSTARLMAITVIIDRMHFRMWHFYGRRSRLKALIDNFSRYPNFPHTHTHVSVFF